MLQVCSINSGSNGNCYYIGNENDAVLIDAGISCKEILKRMDHAGLELKKVKGIFISHEHSDHIRGVETLSAKYQLPVYITDHTYRGSGLSIKPELRRNFNSREPIYFGNLGISAFRKFHDACDPFSFSIKSNGVKVGVFTDIGRTCQNLINEFNGCHAVFLESNYDPDMLENGRYPIYLKNRIRNGQGHLSNYEALDLFTKHRSPFLSHIFLSHLSRENNCPVKAKTLFEEHALDTRVIVASRYEASAIYEIHAQVTVDLRKQLLKPLQLKLSF